MAGGQTDCFLMLSKCISLKQHQALQMVLSHSNQNAVNCVNVLKNFIAMENVSIMNQPLYMHNYLADFNCLKFLFRGTSITDNHINGTLDVLTGVPDRVRVAAKILLNKVQKRARKRAAITNQLESNNKQRRLENEELRPFEDPELLNNAIKRAEFPLSNLEALTPEPNSSIPVQSWSLKTVPLLDNASNQTPNVVADETVDLSVSVAEVEVHTETEVPLTASSDSIVVDQKLFFKVLEMFPDVSRNHLNEICQGKQYNDTTFAEVLDQMLRGDYPKEPARAPSPEIFFSDEQQLAMVKELLPDADPTFLEQKIQEFGHNKVALQNFIEGALVTKEYPTMKQYLRRQQLSAQQKQYTTEFNVERFVELFPDPKAIFEAPERISPLRDSNDHTYVVASMRKKYPQCYVRDIESAIGNSRPIYQIVRLLDERVAKGFVKKSKTLYNKSSLDCQNIPLLQELAYFENRHKILDYIETKKQQDADARLEAKRMGLLQTCSCCFDDEVMPGDIFTCPNGCRFCKYCVKSSTEIAIGEGKIKFPCLSGNCDTEFSLQVLQSVLAPKTFSKMAQKKAVAEVKAAGIEDLESCPFCDFAQIPTPEDKLFRCLNPECMKESCRQCKEPSHVPLRCDEIEKDEAVKARTYIENKMSDALIRKCWSCGNRFIKEEGCNKMTCMCGAMTCYICRKPVKDYTHFNGKGGDRFDLCPLYTDNFTVNEKNVLEAATSAKKEVDLKVLKHDPTVGLETQLNIFRPTGNQLPPYAHNPMVRLEFARPVILPNNINQPLMLNHVAQGAVPRYVQHPGRYQAPYQGPYNGYRQ